VSEVQEIVANASKIRALGSRHSFNDLADSPHDLLCMDRLNQVVGIDSVGKTVTVQGGITYGDLANHLQIHGFALHNLASLPHISVAGAVATATHGSGNGNGNLSTAVSALQIVQADGVVTTLGRQDGAFDGAVVGLGALGVVTELTLDVLPTFDVAQSVYKDLSFDALLANFDEISSLGYSVSLFTNWDLADVWVKQVRGQTFPEQVFGALPATHPMHPLAGMPTENCTPQLGEFGPWHQRLPHFRMEFTPSNGEELQSEYFVPREHAVQAIATVRELRAHVMPNLHVTEIRTIAADNLWLSPAYRQDVVGIHFTWKYLPSEVRQLLPTIETALKQFGAKPHWGKVHVAKPNYEVSQFRALANEMDADGKFRNEAVNRALS
jgi:xylitol oxidase